MISLSGGLFEEEASYKMSNIKINEIHNNSKALLKFLHNNVTIENSEFNKVLCVGDNNDSSLILFNSDELNTNLIIDNSNFKDNKSNGPMILFKGNENNILIQNTNMDSNKSYGPLIKNISSKV